MIQREKFQSNLETELRVWLIDQKPKNLSEAAKLADQFVAVRKAERPDMKGHEFKPKFSAESGRSNLNAGTQNPSSVSHAFKVQNEQKPSAANAKYKSSSSGFDKLRVVCYYCKKPGHIMSNCTRRLAKQTSKEDSTVHLVSTFTSPHSEGLADSAVAPKQQEVGLRFKDHCCQVTLIGPRSSCRKICALRDTGALQSLLSEQSVSECHYESTGEFRMIRSITGETVSVPLVRVTLQSDLCSGDFLCGLATSLPSGIDMLSQSFSRCCGSH